MSVNYPTLPERATPAIPPVLALRLVAPSAAPDWAIAGTGAQASAPSADVLVPHSSIAYRVQPRDPGFDAGAGVLIEPSLIGIPARVMRSQVSLDSAQFVRFLHDVARCGGNVAPVLLRLLAPRPDGQPRYELISGHRRLEACQRLGITVFALVIGASDAAAAQALARSNRLHAKPSPYELGGIYRQLLIDAVYKTQKDLAEHLGANNSDVTNALILARLDIELLSAFESPLRLRYGDARVLRDAWKNSQTQVRQRIAQVLRYPAQTFTHDQTVEILLGSRPATADDESKARKILVHVGPTLVATIRMASSGRVVIELAEKNWSLPRLNALVPGLQALLGGETLELDMDFSQWEAS